MYEQIIGEVLMGRKTQEQGEKEIELLLRIREGMLCESCGDAIYFQQGAMVGGTRWVPGRPRLYCKECAERILSDVDPANYGLLGFVAGYRVRYNGGKLKIVGRRPRKSNKKAVTS